MISQKQVYIRKRSYADRNRILGVASNNINRIESAGIY